MKYFCSKHFCWKVLGKLGEVTAVVAVMAACLVFVAGARVVEVVVKRAARELLVISVSVLPHVVL